MKKLVPLLVLIFLCTPIVASGKNKKSSKDAATEKKQEISTKSESGESGKSEFLRVLGDVEAGVQVVYTEKMLSGGRGEYPKILDKQPDGPCKSCFVDVLGEGINDPRWTKKGLDYSFSDGSFSGTLSYDSNSGKLNRN